MKKIERMYSAFKKRSSSSRLWLRKFRHHLLDGPFILYSDHNALQVAFVKVDIHGGLVRRLEIMAEYAFIICYVEGKQIVLADCL